MEPCATVIPVSVFSAPFWEEEAETEVNVPKAVDCLIK